MPRRSEGSKGVRATDRIVEWDTTVFVGVAKAKVQGYIRDFEFPAKTLTQTNGAVVVECKPGLIIHPVGRLT